MPNVTDLRAASVHEPSGNNGDCTWCRETARPLRWILMRSHSHESQAIRFSRSKSPDSSLILLDDRVWIKGGLMYGTEIPKPIPALSPGPYRPWVQAQRKGPATLRPSWNCLNVKTSFGYWIPRGDRLNFPGQAYEPCPGKSWYARETELPNLIDQAGAKFQGYKCCSPLSPKHPLKSDNIGPSIALAVAVIIPPH